SRTRFLLLGFSDVRELQLVHATLFFLVYLVALAGNLLIVAITTLNRRLYTPMYFFLKHLSVLDLCYISVTVPKSIADSLMGNSSISFWECVFQVFSFAILANAEMAFLTVMSFDRYVAICLPLRYEVLLRRRVCQRLAVAAWFSGGLCAILHVANTFSLPFCGSRTIRQFFCDVPQLLKLACPEGILGEVVVSGILASLASLCFIAILLSYAHIFSTVLRMASAEGRAKAFSTCLPHLGVATLFLSTSGFEYLKPTVDSASALDLGISVFYTVVPPTLNPVIYSLRNREMKAAMARVLGRKGSF
uniref:Olfactory receptor n=1 Tax=Ornithorhynchus anatinus TaxID=9258 RepID=F6RHL2_ORNAN